MPGAVPGTQPPTPHASRFDPVQSEANKEAQRQEFDLDAMDLVFLAAKDLAVGMNHQGLPWIRPRAGGPGRSRAWDGHAADRTRSGWG